MQLHYTKMHGTGNRILVVDDRNSDRSPPDAAALRALGDETTGPGFDQLMWVQAARDASAAASYRVFNADGSEVEQCGNGARCVAWLLRQRDGLGPELRLDSPAGSIDVRIERDGRISLDMGRPVFEPRQVPFEADAPADRYEIKVDDEVLEASVLSMGNPHCVLFVDDVLTADVERLGPLLERHPRFPQRVNVGFMAVRDRHTIDLRVFERGVGETLACGTGACAAVVTGRRLDLLDDPVAVNLPGGQLVVSWRGNEHAVWLTGGAEILSEGTIDL